MDKILRNLTTADFTFTNRTQAESFWLLASKVYSSIDEQHNLYTRAFITNLTSFYTGHWAESRLAYAATNSSVTEAIKGFLPLEYSTASHDWIFGQLTNLTITYAFHDRINNLARDGLCHDIQLDKPLLAAGNSFSLLLYALIISVAIPSVLIYLVHSYLVGPRTTAFRDETREQSRLRHSLQSPATTHPEHYGTLLFTVIPVPYVLSAGTAVWAVFTGSDEIAYNYNIGWLTARIALTTTSCLFPLFWRVLDPRATIVEGDDARDDFMSVMHCFLIAMVDMFVIPLSYDFGNPRNLTFRDQLCVQQYLSNGFAWARWFIFARYGVWIGMRCVWGIWVWGRRIYSRHKNEFKEKWWWDGADKCWSRVHPLKIWVVLEFASLAQACYAVWAVRTEVTRVGLYRDFERRRWDGSLFVPSMLVVLMIGVGILIATDLSAKREWIEERIGREKKVVDGSGNVGEVELEELRFDKLDKIR